MIPLNSPTSWRALLKILPMILLPVFCTASDQYNPQPAVPPAAQVSEELWVSAYMASYYHEGPSTPENRMPTGAIDFDAITHLFYFALNVESDGTLSPIADGQSMSPANTREIVSAAHNAGVPILLTLGGWGNHDSFAQGIRPENRDRLIADIVSVMQEWRFDGIDLDLEPIEDSDLENYGAFVESLHQTLQSTRLHGGKTPLLTAVTIHQPSFFARKQHLFDQINLMTYDYSGAWGGWVSWHNAAVYSSATFPGSRRPLPSADQTVRAFLDAGVESTKMGIGIDFYGYAWQGGSGTATGGVTSPNQSWRSAPSVTANIPYHQIMDQYRSVPHATYQWDDQAKAAWLSIDAEGNRGDYFISFDDERSVREKFTYARERNLGGLIIWELTGGYRRNLPQGQRNILMKTVGDQR